MDFSNHFLIFIGKVVAYGGGAAAVAYGVFIFLGKKWIENKFSERLEALRHAQERDLEEYRHKMNSMFSKISKVHEKEFEVLPTAWSKLHDSVVHITNLTSVFVQYADISKLTDAELPKFLDDSEIPKPAINRILQSLNKQEEYQDQLFWRDVARTRKIFGVFHDYLNKNRIFMSSELKNKFMEIDQIIWHAIVDRETSKETGDFDLWRQAWKRIKDKIDPLVDELEILVQARLHYADAE